MTRLKMIRLCMFAVSLCVNPLPVQARLPTLPPFTWAPPDTHDSVHIMQKG